MIFNTLSYFFLFLLPTALLFRFAPFSVRPWICALAGIAFFVYYALGMPGAIFGAACVLLILWQSFCCVYLCRQHSRLCLLVALQAVLVLVVFKYLNFFGGLLFGKPENSPFYWKDAFLPLGISFFTFEFVHFAVDRYKGKIDDERVGLGNFLAFIFYFPTMVAGPIKRFQDFAPKLESPRAGLGQDFHYGITRILYGLAKKFAVADLLTAITDHLNPTDIAQASGRGALLLWLFAYGIKIYADFSAYSDIAIGSARLFGIRVPENFDSPYIRRNIAEFWSHWHISLYRWLVDYVFIPLGGSRVPPVLIYRNLIIVMLASGIWHGAGLNFLAWGAWHALLLCIHRLWSQWLKSKASAAATAEPQPSPWYISFASWLVTYVSVNLGWAFFAMDWNTALLFFQRLITG